MKDIIDELTYDCVAYNVDEGMSWGLSMEYSCVIDDLTYSCVAYNVDNGVSWDSVEKLFPDNVELMKARYESECRNSGIGE